MISQILKCNSGSGSRHGSVHADKILLNLAEESKSNDRCGPSNTLQRQPAIFVNHGGGPMPYLQHKGKQVIFDSTFIISSLLKLGEYINKYKPKALCIVSAHWESSKPTVLYHKSPQLYFD